MANSKALMILKKARDLLSPEKRWIKGTLRSGYGPEARYCLLGALQHAGDGDDYSESYYTAKRLLRTTINAIYEPQGFKNSNIPAFNDHAKTTHAMALTALDSAIEAARNEGATPS